MPLSSLYKTDILLPSGRASATEPLDCHTARAVTSNLQHHADMALQHQVNYCAWHLTEGSTYFGPSSSDYGARGLWSPWISVVPIDKGDDGGSYGASHIVNAVPIAMHSRPDGSGATIRVRCRFTVESGGPSLDSEVWGCSIFPLSMGADPTLIQSVPYCSAASASWGTITIPPSQLSRYLSTMPTKSSSGGNADLVVRYAGLAVFWYQWAVNLSASSTSGLFGLHFTSAHLSEVVGD